MKNIKFVCDSAVELCREKREKINLEYAPCTYFLHGKEYAADVDWENVSESEFYDAMRKKEIIKTAQVSVKELIKVFEPNLKAGKDIIYFACSSAISGGINSAFLAKEELLKSYTDRKIYIVDTLMGGSGIGLMVFDAYKKIFEQNMDVEKYIEWFEDNKLRFQMVGSVDDCSYLARSGRISGPKAFMANILSLKPIVISNCKGFNFSICTVKGRKSSLRYCVDYVKKYITAPNDYPVIVCNADCKEDGEKLKELVENEIQREVWMERIGPCVGSAVGPGQIALYFFGEEVDSKWQ